MLEFRTFFDIFCKIILFFTDNSYYSGDSPAYLHLHGLPRHPSSLFSKRKRSRSVPERLRCFLHLLSLVVSRIAGVYILYKLLVLLLVVGEHRLYPGAVFAVVVVLCDLYHQPAEEDHGDEVRDRHEAVEGVCDCPCQLAVDDGGDDDQNDKDDLEGHDRSLLTLFTQLLEQELGALFAVVGPCKNGGEGEQRKDDAEAHGAEHAEVVGEGAKCDSGILAREGAHVVGGKD